VDDVNIAEILERIRYVPDLAMVRKDERVLRDVDGRMEDGFCFRVPMRKEPHIMAPLDQTIRQIGNDELCAAVPDGRHVKWSDQSDTHTPSELSEAGVQRNHKILDHADVLLRQS
jgi:hypothetical protein